MAEKSHDMKTPATRVLQQELESRVNTSEAKRILNVLLNYGIFSRALLKSTPNDILECIPGIGKKSLKILLEIKSSL